MDPAAPKTNQAEAETNRAAQEAEQRVSLSAATITQILRDHPGLLLAVKKALVRRAYEQGRLLDPADLTDDALFELLQQDNNTRILATREIVDRRYVQVKPTARELRQSMERKTVLAEKRAKAMLEDREDTANEANRYWPTQEPATNQPSEARPEAPDGLNGNPSDRAPELELDHSRNQDLAAMEPLPSDSVQSLSADAESLRPVTPSELPELFRAGLKEDSRSESGSSGFEELEGKPTAKPFPDSRNPAFDPRNSNFFDRTPPRKRTLVRPPVESEDHATIQRQPNPYASVPSLYDLYEQVSQHTPVARRFGLEVFQNGTGNFDRLPMDVPVGPDYVLGPGDGLNIEIWGSVAERLQRVVDRQGVVTLPETGGVQVAGRSLGDAQRLVQSALRTVLTGRTAVIIAHRLSTVAIADRVLVLDRGRIAEDGPPGELMAGEGEYADLHSSWAASLA